MRSASLKFEAYAVRLDSFYIALSSTSVQKKNHL